MKSITKIIFLILFLSPFFVKAQAVTWQKWYDYNNLEDSGADIIQTFDSGYVILSNSYTGGNTKSAVFKTDEYGVVEWKRLYDQINIGGNFLTCNTITQGDDSCYIISGSNRDSAVIFKINKIGDIKWIKRYSKLDRIDGGFLNHKITHDGGIIACGYLYDPSIGYVVKTDSIGRIEWDSVYNSVINVFRVIESSDGSFYFLGNGLALFKTDKNGNTLWKKNFVLPANTDLIEHASGFIFVGGGGDSMSIQVIDSSSITIFQKSYYIGDGFKGCRAMCESRDGNILLAGVQNTTMVVSKIKPNGELIFSKPIPTINNTEYAFLTEAVNSTNDSGFIFTGFTNYPPNFLESNIYATKTDSACNAPLMVGITNNNSFIPQSFILYPNYPNPFNPTTKIKFDLSKSGFVNLKIFDLNGKEICDLVNQFKQAGSHEIIFNSYQYNLSSGMYFCKLSFGNKSNITKLVLLK